MGPVKPGRRAGFRFEDGDAVGFVAQRPQRPAKPWP